MGEIKFRARHTVPYPGEWYYGSSEVLILPLSIFWLQVENGVLDKNTVGECMGLRDKNGKEIYKGDIINCQFIDGTRVDKDGFADDYHSEVNTRILIKDIHTPCNKWNGKFPSGGHWHYEGIEVIGNIYENPELLDAK